MVNLIDDAHLDQIRKFKVMFARYQRSRDLIAVGAYVAGADPVADAAIALYPQLEAYLRQDWHDQANFVSSVAQLQALTAR